MAAVAIAAAGPGRRVGPGLPFGMRLGAWLAAATLLASALAIAAEQPWVIHFGEGGSVRHSGDPATLRGTEARSAEEAARRGERVSREAVPRVAGSASPRTAGSADLRRAGSSSDRTFTVAEERRSSPATERTERSTPRDTWRPSFYGSVRQDSR